MVSLIPARHKDCFAPDIEPSKLIEEDDFFEALSTIDWDPDDVQIVEAIKTTQGKEEVAQK